MNLYGKYRYAAIIAVMWIACLPILGQTRTSTTRLPGSVVIGGSTVTDTYVYPEYQYVIASNSFQVVPKSSGTYTGRVSIQSSQTHVTIVQQLAGQSGQQRPVTAIGQQSFMNCSVVSVSIPSSVTAIHPSAFKDCNISGGSLTIPESVTSIQSYALDCTGLTKLIMLGTTPPVIESSTFGSTDAFYESVVLEVPTGSISAYRNAAYWKQFRTITDGTTTDFKPYVITINDVTVTYGDELPNFTYSAENEIEGSLTLTCVATEKSPAGTYEITANAEGMDMSQHNVVNGTLTIKQAPLTVSVGNYTKKQGEQMPVFIVGYEGFKNGETESALSSVPVLSYDATKESAPGDYPITLSGASAKNYSITYQHGMLTVTEADPVVITAKSYTRQYGAENPVFEFTQEGVALQGTPVLECAATATSPVGTYPITISRGTVTNYNVKTVVGTLTIEKAPLTISAGNYTCKEGVAIPSFTPIFTGFKNGETETVLSEQPILRCDATSASSIGEYPVTVSGASAVNYDFTYKAGLLTIASVENAVSAQSVSTEVDETIDVPLMLSNDVDVTAFQFDLQLPEGIEFEEVISSSRMSKLQLRDNEQTDGTVRVVGFSSDLYTVTGNSGELLQIRLKINKSAYKNSVVQVSNIRLSTPQAQAYLVEDTQIDVTVTSGVQENLDNVLEFADVKVACGASVTLPISMKNEESITAVSFEVSLPEGASLVSCELTDRKSDQTLMFSELPNGNYQVLAFSMTSKAFKDSEGALVNLQLATEKEMEVGEYDVTVKNIELTTADEEALHPADCTAKLTVTDVMVGDSNGDGKISITDAVVVVNYILNKPSSNFVSEAADVNMDGKISITDAVVIVNKILAGTNKAKSRVADILLDPQ